MRLKAVTGIAALSIVLMLAVLGPLSFGGAQAAGIDTHAIAQQLPGEHSTLCTSDGGIRDDELADYIASKIPKDGNGVPQVKDVKIMCAQCYGGGMADDFERIFGPGGTCEGVPWVFGSSSRYDEPAEGWADGTNTNNGFGSCWTDALAGADSSPTNPTDGSIRDGTSSNVQEDFETARDNDDSGPNHDNAEQPVVASGNGGENIQWNAPGTWHEAVVFGGSQTDQRHHNNVDNVEEALEGVWSGGDYIIQKIDGGTTQDLKDAIDFACIGMDKDTQLVLYFDDHGDTDFDFDEFMDWLLPYPISYLMDIYFYLHLGWVEGLTAMYRQPSDTPLPFLKLWLDTPIFGEEWNISLNDVTIPLPSGELTGKLELPVGWQSIYTGENQLEISTSVATDPMVLNNLELCSGPINEIEKQPSVGGVWIPVDKLGLLAPYIGLASTVIVATAAIVVYVKRVKRRKEKQ